MKQNYTHISVILSRASIVIIIATILSVAMMLRYSLDESAMADRIEKAVDKVLDQNLRTADIYSDGMTKVSCSEMGDAVVAAL